MYYIRYVIYYALYIYYIIYIVYYLYLRVSLINEICMEAPLQEYVFLTPIVPPIKKVCVVSPLPVHISSLWFPPPCC